MHRAKALALEYKGGRCVICGYCACPAALEFHHVDPETKEFGAASIRGMLDGGFTERVKAELDKCILLCANCHREVHAGFRTPPSGPARGGTPVSHT